MTTVRDKWESSNAYDVFMGRWSRLVANEFLEWIEPRAKIRWLDLGCGTGALTGAILAQANPGWILGCDPSEALLTLARNRFQDQRVDFLAASGGAMPLITGAFDAVVSGLALNFVPNPEAAINSLAEVLTPGGLLAAYVWDYAEGMRFLRIFWDAAATMDASATQYDEGDRFPLCAPEPLSTLFQGAGLEQVEVIDLEIPTLFDNFADYWEPFLGGTGPAPSYVASLGMERRRQLRETLRERLRTNDDGRIELTARAWAVRGTIGRI